MDASVITQFSAGAGRPVPWIRTGLCLLLCVLVAGCGSSGGDAVASEGSQGQDVVVGSDTDGDAGGSADDVTDGSASGDDVTADDTADDDVPTDTPLTQLVPLPAPPLTPAPAAHNEPVPVSGQVGTVSEYFLVRDPVGWLPDDPADGISEEAFAAGPLPAEIQVPDGVDPSLNAAPYFIDLTDQVVFAGDTLELRLRPYDPDGGFAGMYPESLPVGAAYDDNFDGTRTFRWRPLQPDVGIHAFTMTAIDPVEPWYRTRQTIRIKVVMPDDPSTIINLPPSINLVREHTVRVNDPVVVQIKGNDPNGTIPQLSITNLPAGATFEPHREEPGISVLHFIPRETGPVTLTVIARDAVNPDSIAERSFTLHVREDADFQAHGTPLRILAGQRGLLFGYASLKDYYYQPDGAVYEAIAAREFNIVSPENSFKWDVLNPRPGIWRWASADNLLSFARLKSQHVHGHTLVWHRQLPGWLKRSEPADREAHMREYIDRVLSRYPDVPIWDVVNEAIDDSGGLRQSIWHDAMGEDFIDIAFRQARESAPGAVLVYNDYDIAWHGPKSETLLPLLERLLARGTPIDAVGFQMHLFAKFDQSNETRELFNAVAALGLDIYITELDVSMEADDSEARQAAVYREVLSVCLEQPRCKAIQIWGFTDMYSWRGDFSPLIYDRAFQPKPAYFALQERLAQ